MRKIINFCKSHLNFKFYNINWLNVFVLLLIFPACRFLPLEAAYENSWFENIQLVVLFWGMYLALTTKFNKTFFKFAALVIGILLIRETNCLRTIFFCVPGEPNTFYTWKEIKYGWLFHPLYGCYIAWTGVYFIWKKLYLDLWKYVKNVKFPVWNGLILIFAIVCSWAGEEIFHNMMFEECSELLAYTDLGSVSYLYSRKQEFNAVVTKNL